MSRVSRSCYKVGFHGRLGPRRSRGRREVGDDGSRRVHHRLWIQPEPDDRDDEGRGHRHFARAQILNPHRLTLASLERRLNEPQRIDGRDDQANRCEDGRQRADMGGLVLDEYAAT